MSTVKKLSYAGVTIPLSEPTLEGWLASVNPQDFKWWDGWNYDQPNTRSLPTPSLPVMPEFQVGVLTWPTGYSRPSSFNFVTTTERLALITAAQGSINSPQSLMMFDGRTGKTVTASMYMLPPRPINLLNHNDSDAWMVTLTDQRFYSFWRRGSITTPVSWTDLYSQIGAILGVTITPDTVDSRYGTPSGKWALKYAPMSVLLDSVAAQVGQRVVVALDGSVKTVNWTTARDASITYINSSDVVVSGGVLNESDIARYVPSAVRVLSLDTSTSPPSASPHVETKTLASLSIAGYGAATGVSGFYQTLNSDLPYTGSNPTAVADYATVAATDWYGWRLPDTDLVYPGIEPWAPTGWEECVEWTFQKRSPEPFASTRVRRGSWSDMISGDWYAGQGPSNPDPFNPCGTGLVPGCVPTGGSGSGSGSGAGCDRVVETLDVSCGTGTRTLTSKFLDLQVVNGRIEMVECSTQDYDLGPCSPTNPDGTQVPVVTAVCPVFTEIQYLDWDAVPQTARVVTGINLERRLVVVPVAGPIGCVTDMETCCEGSGSGSGEGGVCTTDCDQCDITSEIWEIVADGAPEGGVLVYHVDQPDDGNYCRWVSGDLRWQMYFDYGEAVWVITRDTGTQNEAFWLTDVLNCLAETEFSPGTSGLGLAVATPVAECTGPTNSYNCVDGTCVEVEGAGGQYPTLDACNNACGGTVTACGCTLPTTLYAHFLGDLATVGTVTLTYDSGSGTYVASAGLESCLGTGATMAFACSSVTPGSGSFSVAGSGPDGSFFGTGTYTCPPMSGTGTGLSSGTCAGSFSVTVDATP